MTKHVKSLAAVFAAIFCTAFAGCSPPVASLDLITVARQGIAMAKQSQQEQNEIIVKQFASQQAALDAAFDADVRLAASGGINDADGNKVALTPDWIISARKGYIAARDTLSTQIQQSQAATAVRMDNLQASDEALDMAAQLIIQQQGLAIKLQQQLINVQRKFANGK